MVGEAYSNVSVELQCCFFFLIEPNLYRPYNSRMSFLGIHSSEMHSCVHHKTNIIHNIQMEITQNSIKIRMFK